jgi:hypothetical protein
MFWYYHMSKPEGSVTFRSGSNPSHGGGPMARANPNHTTVPLYSLSRDWKLRRIFWQAGRDLGDEFAVPLVPPTGLNGGAAVSAELVEA